MASIHTKSEILESIADNIVEGKALLRTAMGDLDMIVPDYIRLNEYPYYINAITDVEYVDDVVYLTLRKGINTKNFSFTPSDLGLEGVGVRKIIVKVV